MRIRTSFFVAACMGLALGGVYSSAMADNGSEKSRVYVVFKNGAMGPAHRALKREGAEFHHTFDKLNAFVVSMPAQALKGLRNNPNIEFIEEDVKRYPMAQSTPYGIPMVQADLVSDSAAANRKVCIIDSGYQANHPDLPVAGGDTTSDGCSHGTHVAGTIAAVDNNSGVLGVLPNGKIGLHIVKVFGGASCAWTYSSTLVAALGECEDAGANVVSMSLGGGSKSRSEDRAFSQANGRGVLSIAAAGNDGNTRKSYPASYNSVVSVAAIDSAKVVADFSQQNDQVELAAPGVSVRSTVETGSGFEESATVGGTGYEAIAFDGSANGTSSGTLVDCGLGENTCAGASGNVCLIERGNISFADKVANCEAGGGDAAIIYNNAPGLFSGTLGGSASIPAVGVSQESGQAMASGSSASVTVGTGDYAYYDGTSMATPHVSGVAALVWSHDPTCTNEEIRSVLAATAEDLGPVGRDVAYGYGLVQAADAVTALATACGGGGGGGGGGGSCTLSPKGASCSANSDCCSNSCKGKPGNKTCK